MGLGIGTATAIGIPLLIEGFKWLADKFKGKKPGEKISFNPKDVPEGLVKLASMSPEQQQTQLEALKAYTDKIKEPIFTEDQIKALNIGLSASGPLQQYIKSFKPFDFAPIEKEARSKFARETIPSIAERFTSQGIQQRSSAFPQLLGQAGAQLDEALAAQKAGINLQREGQGLQVLQNLFSAGTRPRTEKAALLGALGGTAFAQPFQYLEQPREPSGFESLLSPVASGGARAATEFALNKITDYFGGKKSGGIF